MARKLALVGFSYLAGLVVSSLFIDSLDISAAAAAAAAVIAVIMLIKRNYGVFVSIMTAIAAMTAFTVSYNLADMTAADFCDGDTHRINAVVLEKTETGSDLAVYCLSTVYNGKSAKFILYADDKYAEYGDTVECDVAFSGLKENTVGSVSSYYLSKGITLKGALKSELTVKRGTRDIFYYFSAFRKHITRQISFFAPDDTGALMRGIFLGNKSGFSGKLAYNIKASGAAAFTAVSGVHLTLLIHITAVVLNMLFARRLTALRITLIIVLTLCFMAFFGFTSSVTRAGIMLISNYCGELFFRKSDCLNSLGLSILIITLANPLAVLDAGFILSVVVTVGAGAGAPRLSHMITSRLPRLPRAVTECVCVSVCASAFALPLSAVYFGAVSVYGAAVSVLIAPFFTVALISLLLFALSAGSLGLLLAPAKLCCDIMILIFDITASLPFSYMGIDGYTAGFVLFIGICTVIIALLTAKELKAAVIGCAATAVSAGLVLAAAVPVFFDTDDKVTVIPSSSGSEGSVLIFSRSFSAAVLFSGGENAINELYYNIMTNNIRRLDIFVLCDDRSNSLPLCNSLLAGMTDVIVASENDISIMDSGGLFMYSEKCTSRNEGYFDCRENGVFADFGEVKLNISDISSAYRDALNICWNYSKETPPFYLPAYFADKRQTNLPENGVSLYDSSVKLCIYQNGFTEAVYDK